MDNFNLRVFEYIDIEVEGNSSNSLQYIYLKKAFDPTSTLFDRNLTLEMLKISTEYLFFENIPRWECTSYLKDKVISVKAPDINTAQLKCIGKVIGL